MSRIERDAGVLVDVPDDEAQRDLQRGGKGDAALLAFVDIVFRRLELVAHEFELRALGEIADREDRSEDLLQPDIGALFGAFAHLQEVIVGAFLDLDQVRHRRNLGDASKALADALLAGEGYCHACSSLWAAAGRPDLVSSQPVGASASLGSADRDPTAEAATDPIPIAQPPARPAARTRAQSCRRQNPACATARAPVPDLGRRARRPVVGRRPSEIARSKPTLFRPSHPHLQAVFLSSPPLPC